MTRDSQRADRASRGSAFRLGIFCLGLGIVAGRISLKIDPPYTSTLALFAAALYSFLTDPVSLIAAAFAALPFAMGSIRALASMLGNPDIVPWAALVGLILGLVLIWRLMPQK